MTATPIRQREKLTRERVIDAALTIMDAEGLDAVTMRRVAHEVGVEAMSLYHHVHDKDDLLEGICARVMAEFRVPGDGGGWYERASFAANEWRRVLKQHPNVITLFAERRGPLTDLGSLEPMDHALGILREAGLSDRDAVRVFNVLGGFIMGFVLMEVGQMFGAGAMDKELPDPQAAAQLIPEGSLRHLTAALPYLADCDPEEQFQLGLDMMLQGMRVTFGAVPAADR